jgi:hypothetical protein
MKIGILNIWVIQKYNYSLQKISSIIKGNNMTNTLPSSHRIMDGYYIMNHQNKRR